ncbi:MAG TPA: metallophosphoesterase, partial [Pyrodictium sp.]|nr:metallophosphoesterase [Pyrodictium sp.]
MASLAEGGEVVIAHISDLHVESENYSKELEERLIGYIGELRPDIVVVTGDLTDDGYVHEYRAAVRLLSRFKARKILAVPGNHDSRNMG